MTDVERLPISSSPEERNRRLAIRLAGEVKNAMLVDEYSYVVRNRHGVPGELHEPEVYAELASHIDEADIEVHRFKTEEALLIEEARDSELDDTTTRWLTYDVVIIDPIDEEDMAQWGQHITRLYPSETGH